MNEGKYYRAQKKARNIDISAVVYRNIWHIIRRHKAGYMPMSDVEDYLSIVRRMKPEILRGFVGVIRY